MRPVEAGHKPCLAKADGTPRLCLSASNRGTRNIKWAARSLGPAGRVLDTRALEAPAIDRSGVIYVTNAVKHFKWEPRGKRRIHKKPRQLEIAACRPWLEAEIAVTKPQVVVCLGATAAHSLLGPKFRVTERRGGSDSIQFGTLHRRHRASVVNSARAR